MRDRSRALSPLFHLISLLLLAVALIFLVIFFSNQFLVDISRGTSSTIRIIVPFTLILPLFLLISLIYNLGKLVRDLKNNKSGARFKSRLMLFFMIIAVLSSLPQAILSLTFINTALDSWFSPQTGESLQNGLDIALEFYNDKLDSLQTTLNSPIFEKSLREADRNPRAIWKTLQDNFSDPDAVQIFSGENEWFYGDDRARLPRKPVNAPESGLLPITILNDNVVLQGVETYRGRKGTYTLVVTTILPDHFTSNAQGLTNSVTNFRQMEAFKTNFQIILLVVYMLFAMPLLMLALLASFFLSDEIIRPISDLEQATKAVAEGDFSIRLLGKSDDELAMLKSSFNKMLEELESSRMKNLQTDKVTAWQEIAQRLAHEIKNPLTPIQLSAQRILRKYKTKPEDLGRVLEPAVESIIREVENLNNMLNEFRNFARLPKPQKTASNLSNMINEVISTYGSRYPRILVDRTYLDNTIEIEVDPDQIKQVLANLIKNGFEAIDGDGNISIRADLVRKGNSDYCRIQIQDSGCGIDEEEFGQVFNPYYTSKQEGTGLGLPIVERIIFDHRGQIWFESQKGAGTTFYIDLPMEKQF